MTSFLEKFSERESRPFEAEQFEWDTEKLAAGSQVEGQKLSMNNLRGFSCGKLELVKGEVYRWKLKFNSIG